MISAIISLKTCRQPGSLNWWLDFVFWLTSIEPKLKQKQELKSKTRHQRLVCGSCSLFVKERKRPQPLLRSNDIKKRPARRSAETILNPNLKSQIWLNCFHISYIFRFRTQRTVCYFIYTEHRSTALLRSATCISDRFLQINLHWPPPCYYSNTLHPPPNCRGAAAWKDVCNMKTTLTFRVKAASIGRRRAELKAKEPATRDFFFVGFFFSFLYRLDGKPIHGRKTLGTESTIVIFSTWFKKTNKKKNFLQHKTFGIFSALPFILIGVYIIAILNSTCRWYSETLVNPDAPLRGSV